ncbi:hypothetical protein DVH26_34550 [Paenibacillus sp. H1-7]|nr:hypothetical protein DVH26_34550 [Paenibacillus sp. H1-7]
MDYFAFYGPFAVLFVALFYWTLRTYTHREELHRKEMDKLRAELEEQSRYHYEVLTKFSEKYDSVILEIRDIRTQLEWKRGKSL